MLHPSSYKKDCHVERKNTNKKVEKHNLIDKELITHGKSTRSYTCKRDPQSTQNSIRLSPSVFHFLVPNPSAFHRIRSTILRVSYNVKIFFSIDCAPTNSKSLLISVLRTLCLQMPNTIEVNKKIMSVRISNISVGVSNLQSRLY